MEATYQRSFSDSSHTKTSPLVFSNPRQQIGQPVSRKNHPSISNPACINNVSHRKHGSRLNVTTVPIVAFGNPYPSTVTISNLRRNLEALFSPRFKVGVRKFGKLTPLKLLAVSERRRLVAEPCEILAGGNHAIPKPVQVHRLPRLRHPHTDFIAAIIELCVMVGECRQPDGRVRQGQLPFAQPRSGSSPRFHSQPSRLGCS